MNWRAIGAVAVSLIIRAVLRPYLGWTYRPFVDPFSLLEFGRDLCLFLFLFALSLAIINAVLGPKDSV